MNRLNKDTKLTPQLTRLYSALCCGDKVDSISCGEKLGIAGSALHSRLSELKNKGLVIADKKERTKFGTVYKSYYLS